MKTHTYLDEIASLKHRGEMSQQKGKILWLTGFSGAGKTTIALNVNKALLVQGRLVYILDGDKVRSGLNSDLGFSDEDRLENIRRIGEVAKLFADAGMIIIVACISPFRADRDKVRKEIGPDNFIEVFVDCPLEVCEKRDTKGLYKKARSGIIKDFTGISSPYEPPLIPEIHLKTDQESIIECTNKILSFMD